MKGNLDSDRKTTWKFQTNRKETTGDCKKTDTPLMQ